MKKYLSIFFVAFIAMFSVGLFLACSSDDDDPEYGVYRVDGPNAMSMLAANGIETAIWESFGASNGFCKRDDSKAIRIFDENTKKVRDNSLIQSVTLYFQPSSSDGSDKAAITIKTQTFPF